MTSRRDVTLPGQPLAALDARGARPSTVARELVVLGTSAQTPTATRNQSSYVLRWRDELIVIDPGENTQQLMMQAGVHVGRVDRVLLTHFHGDHCLGLPGLLQRRRLSGRPSRVTLHYGDWGDEHVDRLLGGSAVDFDLGVDRFPHRAGETLRLPHFDLTGLLLDHTVPAMGWRIEEPTRRHLIPDLLAEAGVEGADVGQLQRDGEIDVASGTVRVVDVSEMRRGRSFAFVMDTRPCPNAETLARDVDLLVCEATYLDAETDRAATNGHMTASQAATLASRAGARRLVLSHFSERYDDLAGFRAEAGAVFDDVVVPDDFTHVPLPD
jgi:ribonuclease Z